MIADASCGPDVRPALLRLRRPRDRPEGFRRRQVATGGAIPRRSRERVEAFVESCLQTVQEPA
jgi:hypothetical protein